MSLSGIPEAVTQFLHNVIAGIKAEAAPDSNGASVAPLPETTESDETPAAESRAAEGEGGAKASEEQEAGSSTTVAEKGVESHHVAVTRPATAEAIASRPATAEQVTSQSHSHMNTAW